MDASSFDPVQSIISAAKLYGVDPDFALKIAHQESGINPNVRDSSAGAIGTMQLMPATARGLGVNPRDPAQNIDGGVRYLKQLQDQFGSGNLSIVAGAYNAGPGRMRAYLAGRGGLPAETQNYVRSINGSPITAAALGYTAPPSNQDGPSAAQFIADPAGSDDDVWIGAPGGSGAAAPAMPKAPAAMGGNDDVWIGAPGDATPAAASAAGPTFTGTVPVADDGSALGAAKQLGYHAAASAAELPTLSARGIGAAAHGINWLLGETGLGKYIGVDPNANANADANLASIQASAGGKPALDKIVDAIHAATPAPQSQIERDAGAIGDFAPAALAPGGVVRRVAAAAVPGVASQEAGDAAAQAGLPDTAQAVIKAATAASTGALVAPGTVKAAVPALGAVKDAAASGFKAARKLGLELKLSSVQSLAQGIRRDLETDGFRDYLAPKTFATLGEIATPPGGASVTGTDLMGIRQVLGKAAISNDPTEEAAASRVLRGLDNYLANVPPADVLKGDAAKFSQVYSDARDNYASAMTGQRVQDKINNADLRAASTYSGGNVNNATRQNLRTLLTNKNQGRGLTPDELEMIEDTVRGSGAGNALRSVGKLLGGGGGLHASVDAIGASHFLGPIGFAVPGIGFVVKKAGDAATRRGANRVVSAIATRSPLGQATQAGATIQQGTKIPQAILDAILSLQSGR